MLNVSGAWHSLVPPQPLALRGSSTRLVSVSVGLTCAVRSFLVGFRWSDDDAWDDGAGRR
jgi:hypothetical protein